MLTSSCSPSVMTDGWISLTYCPIFLMKCWWTVLDQTSNSRKETRKEGSQKRKEEISNMKITAGVKNIEDCEICRSRQEVSKKYLMVEFHLIWFWIILIHTNPAAAESGSFKFWEKNGCPFDEKEFVRWRIQFVATKVPRTLTMGSQYKHS